MRIKSPCLSHLSPEAAASYQQNLPHTKQDCTIMILMAVAPTYQAKPRSAVEGGAESGSGFRPREC